MTTEPTEIPAVFRAAAPATAASPGALVREARLARRLSVDELAGLTRLSRATIEALEGDDFAALLEPVYVRGYYRKCAKLLGSDEKALIDAYAARVIQRVPVPPARLRLASGSDFGIGSRLPMTMAVVFVLLAIAVCAFLWWVRGATSLIPHPAVLQQRGTLAPTDPASSLPDENGSSSTMPPVPAPRELSHAAPPAPAAAPETAPVTAQAAAPVVSAAPSESRPASGTGSGRLQLVFKERSWVRIRDADGKPLLDGLVVGGERRAVDGKAPFAVFIGNAPAVGIEFDGQVVDLKPYTRENATARLTLPASP